MVELRQLSDPDKLHVKIGHCNKAIDQLSDSLMSLEVKLNSQLEVSVSVSWFFVCFCKLIIIIIIDAIDLD